MKFTCEITPELGAALKELRATQGVSASAAVRFALTAYLAERGVEVEGAKPADHPARAVKRTRRAPTR